MFRITTHHATHHATRITARNSVTPYAAKRNSGYGREMVQPFVDMFKMYRNIALGVGIVSGGILFVNIGDKIKVEYYGKKVGNMGALGISSIFGFACGIAFPISIPIGSCVIVYNTIMR